MIGARWRWPLVLIAAPAAVSIWTGWVGLGGMCGFGVVHPLPGIWDGLAVNTAITLPVGVEAYGAYALRAWLRTDTPAAARSFARWSALGALALGMAGQIVYHLLTAAGATSAPVPVVVAVSCMPVMVLGFASALTHLLSDHQTDPLSDPLTEQPAQATGSLPPPVSAQPAPRRERSGVSVSSERPALTLTPRPGQSATGSTSKRAVVERAVTQVGGIANASPTAIAKQTGLGVSTVRRHLTALRAERSPEEAVS